ncbi:MAG: Crp/Fnr family transcriptional regulator [Gammaproteobacteria bacterium]|nr:MAG: Crp/Fnr family transcriptional regulator [Gammaproteobacteria bacterium]
MVDTELLRHIPLFEGLDDAQRALLAGACLRRRYPRGALVVQEGEQSDTLYLIIQGQVKVCRSTEDGREVVLSLLREGEHFGEMALLDAQPRSASVYTMTASELGLIRKADFERVLLDNPRLALAIMVSLCQRLRAADRSIESLALMDVYGRVARLLLDLAVDTPDGGRLVRGPLTHRDIAQMVGASREMVTRILGDLARRGHIARHPDGILLRDSLGERW